MTGAATPPVDPPGNGKGSGRAASAVLWSGTDAAIRTVIQFCISVLLARLLLPEDFGAIATLQGFVSLSTVLAESGLGAALVRRQDSSRAEESTVFYFNVGATAVFSALLAAASPAFAHFFRDERLHLLTVVMAANMAVASLASIHSTLLTRALDFRTQAVIGAVSTACSGTTSVALAYKGYGVWSLALGTLVGSLADVGLYWTLSDWRPIRAFDVLSLRKNLRFGVYMMLGGMLEAANTHFNALLIARLFSTRDLGYYARAQGTQQMPVGLMTGVLSRVALPIFAATAGDRDRLVATHRRVQRTVMWLNVPAMLGLAALAQPVVLTVFGAQWLPCVPILRILSLAGVLWPLHVFNLSVLYSQGRSDLAFRLEVAKKVVSIVFMVVASTLGLVAMAWGHLLFSVCAFLINAHFTGTLLGYGAGAQLRDLFVYFVLGLPMAIAVWLASDALHVPAPALLVALAALGCLAYVAASWLLRLDAVREAHTLLRHRKPSSAPAPVPPRASTR